MPYKRTLAGKDKFTGKLEELMNQLRLFHQTDFPPEAPHGRVPLAAYLTIMTSMLTTFCNDRWEDSAAGRELALRKSTWERISAMDGSPASIDYAMYQVLDYIVEHTPPHPLSVVVADNRQYIAKNKREIFFN